MKKKTKVAGDLKEMLVEVSEITPDPENPRDHSDRRGIDALVKSLERFGQMKPIVVREQNRVCVAGNGLLIAARELGWTHVAAVVEKMDDQTARAYSIADNRTAELSEWDYRELANHFRALNESGFDLGDVGYLPHEVEPLLQADFTPPPVGDLNGEMGGVSSIKVTADQRVTIDRAIEKVRATAGDQLSEGRCIELICADWLS